MRRSEGLRLRSVPSLLPAEQLESKLREMGFSLVEEATAVQFGTFWRRVFFRRAHESVILSDQIGESIYLRDPVLTILGKEGTVRELIDYLSV